MFLGVDTGTSVDWLGSDMTNSLDFRLGTYGQGYQPGGNYSGSFNVTITGATGLYSQARNYPNGTYTIQFNAPNPAAVGLSVNGMFSGLSNVLVTGNTYSATFNLQHDGGNVFAGAGEVDLNTSAANPITNFRVLAPNALANPGGLQPNFQATFNRFAGGRYMNNAGINNITVPLTAADYMPSAQNFSNVAVSNNFAGSPINPGNSPTDQAAWSKSNPNAKIHWVSVPLNADDSYIQKLAIDSKAVSAAGQQVIVEYANEPWNFAFAHTGWLYQQSLTDSSHSFADGDTYGRTGEEYGIKSAHVMQVFRATNPSAVGYLNSQGANQWFVDQAKAAIDRNYGSGTVKGLFGYQGISYYPADNLTSDPHTPDGIKAAVLADIPRQHQYLVSDQADAHAWGLKELIYETSPNGLLTQSGVSAAEITAFINSQQGYDAARATLGDISSVLGDGEGAMYFTIGGDPTFDFWGGNLDVNSTPTREFQGVLDFAGSVNGVTTPEPAALALLLPLGVLAASRRTRRRLAA